MSDSTILPPNLAETGPILSAMPIAYWFSPVASTLSQPGMQSLSTSGSFKASQACCCVTASWRLPCISMVVPRGRRSILHQLRKAARQVLQALQIVDCEHGVCLAVQLGGPTRNGGVAVEAQQRVQPEQAAAAPAQPAQLLG